MFITPAETIARPVNVLVHKQSLSDPQTAAKIGQENVPRFTSPERSATLKEKYAEERSSSLVSSPTSKGNEMRGSFKREKVIQNIRDSPPPRFPVEEDRSLLASVSISMKIGVNVIDERNIFKSDLVLSPATHINDQPYYRNAFKGRNGNVFKGAALMSLK